MIIEGINIHANCESRLKSELTEQLQNIKVKNNMFLDRSTTLCLLSVDRILPDKGELYTKLVKYVKEHPLLEFIDDILARELYDNNAYESGSDLKPLSQVEGFQSLSELSNRYIEAFKTLPWNYTLTIKLPIDILGIANLEATNYDLGLGQLLRNDALLDSLPLSSGNERKDRNIHNIGILSIGSSVPSWESDCTYLTIPVTGYIEMFGDTTPIFNAVSFIKALHGFGIAERFCKRGYKYPQVSEAHCYVHRRHDEVWKIDSRYKLDNEVSRILNDLSFNDCDGYFDTDLKKSSHARNFLEKSRKVFTYAEKTEKAQLACQWLYDSYGGANELLSFLQAMVVIEILLGDKKTSDDIGLGELLRNRCAYFLGSSNKERNEILEQFSDIYKIRSQIVHNGKPKLLPKDRLLFNTLHWLCRRLIVKETEMHVVDFNKLS